MVEPNPRTLDFEAFLYATGQLSATEQSAFEMRLGQEQETRDALSRTVQGVLHLAGNFEGTPPLDYRGMVRQQLGLPTPGLLRTSCRAMWGSYSYRGHPIFWTLVGALVAILLFTWYDEPGASDDETTTAPVAEAEAPAEEITEVISVPDEVAATWAELHTPAHLQRVAADNARRRARVDDDADLATDPAKRVPLRSGVE